MKRNKDRHQLAYSSSFRYQRPSSPYLVEDGESSTEHGAASMIPFACPPEVNTSTLPKSPAFLKCQRDRSNSSCSYYRGSPYDLSVHSPDPLRRNSDPMGRNLERCVASSPLPMDMEEEEYDQPLDMSKKSRTLSTCTPPSSESPHFHHNNLHSHSRNIFHHYSHHQPLSSSSSSSSTSSRSNTCSPESIYRRNHIINGANNEKSSFIEFRQNSIYPNHHNRNHHNQHHQQSPLTNDCPSNGVINHYNHINSHSNGNPHMQPRPSVITHASTLLGPRRSHPSNQQTCSNGNSKDESNYSSHHNSSLNHQLNSEKALNTSSPRPSSLASTSSSSSLSSFSSSSSCSSLFARHQHSNINNKPHHHQHSMRTEIIDLEKNDKQTINRKKLDEPKKLLILGEDSDSGIDEHFRRSLGDSYRNYTNVSMSVDDHFAKALGDTWLKLKREAQNGSKGNSYNKPNTAKMAS